MAEVTGLRNVVLPYPCYGMPYGIVVPLLDADGDLVSGATTPDTEISKNGDTFADCTNEMTEIATNSGVYYILLTGTEMTADVVTLIFKSATAGMKTTVATLYPRKLVTIRSGTSSSAGSATSTIVLDVSASLVDDFYNGMIVAAVIDGVTEVRMITDYVGSTQTATVTPDWNTAPDNNDTFVVYRPDGVQIQQANATHLNSTAQTARDIGASVLLSSGTGTGQVKLASGYVAPNWGDVGNPTTTVSLTNTTVATVTTTATATNVTTVNGLAANVITAAATAADFGTEVGAAVLSALGTGSWATSLAPAATALSTAVWTAPPTGFLAATFPSDPADASVIAGRFDTLDTSVADLPTNAELATALGAADDAVLAQVALVKAKTDNLPSDPADQSLIIAATDALVTLIGDVPTNAELATALGTADDATLAAIAALNNLSAAQVNAEVDTALADIRLDELLSADSDIDGVAPPTVGSVFHELLSKTAGSFTFDQTTDSLEALRDRGDAAWTTATGFSTLTAADVRTAVGLASANLDTQLDALPTAAETTSAVWANGTRTVTSLSGLTVDTVTTLVNLPAITANWLTAAGAAADFTTEIQAGLATAASIAALNNLSAAQVRTELSTELARIDVATSTRMATYTQPTGFLAASFPTDPADQSLVIAATDAVMSRLGLPAGASVSADVAAVLARTDVATSTRASQTSLDTLDDIVDTEVGAIKTKTDQLTFTVANRVDSTTQAGVSTLTTAQVNAEVDTALADYDAPTNAELEARTLVAANYATAAALVTVDTVVDAILADTGTDGVVVASLASNSVTAASLAADAGTEIGTAVWASGTRTLTSSGSGPTADEIADAVWDEATADHTTAGSTGKAVSDAGSGSGSLGPGTVILTIDAPTDRLVDADGNQITELTLAQVLAGLFITLLGDRGGIGTREIIATVPGTTDVSITATRISRSTVESTVRLPITG